jgi:hypothetical protein
MKRSKLRRRYGRASASPHYQGAARNFLHPIIVREAVMAPLSPTAVTEKDVQELAGLLERVAARARKECS